MSEPVEPPDPNLDHQTRAELAELNGPAADTAAVLDEWLMRAHGVMSSAHYVGLFLDLLADRGWRVEPIQAPSLDELLPPPTITG